MSDVIVLAGGWSVSQYNIRGINQRGFLIGVNDAALFTRAACAITMDRMWFEGRYNLLHTLGVPEIWIRKGIDKNNIARPSTKQFDCDDETVLFVSDEPNRLNGTNSGACAMNLAFNKATPGDRVFMLGFDMCRGPNDEKHWYPDYPWAYSTKPSWFTDWAQEFESIAQQFKQRHIHVYNVNHRSAIEAFNKISYEEFLRMTS